MNKEFKRTEYCGELNIDDVGRQVVLNGWVNRRRDHGGLIFVDLRDRTGIVQLVFDPKHNNDSFELAQQLKNEWVIGIKGKINKRPEGSENLKIPTGEIEILVDKLTVFSRSNILPFNVNEEEDVDEYTRLRYRFLDLRRPRLQKNIELRHRVSQIVRKYLSDSGFWEVETPMLTRSTPEGARDYLVPSRVHKGKFYALPQSPQLFKQMLMVSGIDRYFQIARCFRDEDLRADRQPEFTQIDLEASFIDEEDIFSIIEGLMYSIFKGALDIELTLPFPRMSYREAYTRFGTDRPDIRYDTELYDVSDILNKISFPPFQDKEVIAIRVSGRGDITRKGIDELTDSARALGAKGLAWLSLQDEPRGPFSKFLNGHILDRLKTITNSDKGDLLLFIADEPGIARVTMGRFRLEINRRFFQPNTQYAFLWIVDFPLFSFNKDENRIEAEHHPFTSPKDEDIHLLETEPLKVRANAYDLVLNGVELGSGSIRNSDPEMQKRVFSILGIDEADAYKKFGFLLEALSYGAPPHGGMALGLDRIVAIMAGEESIREVLAFPKTQNAFCPLTEAPSEVDENQLKELGISIRKEEVL
ncbi:MAG TPA: aspartate--tRNA ligase [bacterium]|nr:aspartate--tRNA ligase [bacterium]HPO81923.1 aspartate--tRNA ligase [bacterium]